MSNFAVGDRVALKALPHMQGEIVTLTDDGLAEVEMDDGVNWLTRWIDELDRPQLQSVQCEVGIVLAVEEDTRLVRRPYGVSSVQITNTLDLGWSVAAALNPLLVQIQDRFARALDEAIAYWNED